MQLRVRNYEVDWQGIVHNANYLLYCEIGRVEYLKAIGASIDLNSINRSSKVVLARNEIDYKHPARFDDLLNVYTRIASIRNSSFVMEGIVQLAASEEMVAENVAYHVWLDHENGLPKNVPDEFRQLVQSYEGETCEVFWPTAKV
jgi:acyl-CoA thioester hydrolase